MARRKKQQTDPVAALFMLLMLGAFFLIFNMTKSLMLGVVAAGFVLATFLVIGLILKAQREERLKRSGIAEIDKMDGRQFELYLDHLFKAHGYSVEVTRAAGDYGADLVVNKGGRKTIIQAKRYSKNVGLNAVQEAHTAIRHYNAHDAWVVTNRFYTEQAHTLAKSNGVKLVDREQLIEMVLKLNPGTAPSPKSVMAAAPSPKVLCTRCGSPMVHRKSAKGEFLGCSSYPKCRSMIPVAVNE